MLNLNLTAAVASCMHTMAAQEWMHMSGSTDKWGCVRDTKIPTRAHAASHDLRFNIMRYFGLNLWVRHWRRKSLHGHLQGRPKLKKKNNNNNKREICRETKPWKDCICTSYARVQTRKHLPCAAVVILPCGMRRVAACPHALRLNIGGDGWIETGRHLVVMTATIWFVCKTWIDTSCRFV